MKVIVTGHTGYIGSVLVPMLGAAGHDVTGFDTDFFSSCDFNGGIAPVPNISKDVREATAADLAGFDAVIHLAAESHVDRSILGSGPFVTTNVLGTQVLLDAIREWETARRARDDAFDFVRELGVRLGEAGFEFGEESHGCETW